MIQISRKIIPDINISYLFGFLILIYLIFRIIELPLSDDEYMTLHLHVSQNLWNIVTTGQPNTDWAPNNHVLNTLMMKFEIFLFGRKDWVMRIHIFLSFIVCFYYSYKLFSLFVPSEYRKLFYLIIIFLNPYLLDFFGLARGYALSITAFTGALYYLIVYLDQFSIKPLILTLFFMFLAIWSNFSALYLFAGVICIIIFENRKNFFSTDFKTQIVILAVASCLIGIVIIFPLIKTLASGETFGGKIGIFQDSVVQYINQFIHHNPKIDRHQIYPSGWKLIEILGVILFLLWTSLLAYSFTFDVDSRLKKIQNICLFLVLLVAFIAKVLFILKQTPFPSGRTQLLFGVPFYIGICIAIERILIHQKRFYFIVILQISFLIWHFYHSFNLVNTIDWWQNGDAKKVVSFLKSEYRNENSGKIKHIGAENWQYHSLAFYIEEEFHHSLQIHWTDLSSNQVYDYLLVPKHRQSEVWADYIPIREFDKTILFKLK